MTAEYTPGPWFVFGNGHCVGGLFTPGPGDEPGRNTAAIAMCGMRLRTNDEAQANARLIAAAPDLLAALDRLLYETEEGTQPCSREVARAARTALARALGTG